jgi:hypothetical protein
MQAEVWQFAAALRTRIIRKTLIKLLAMKSHEIILDGNWRWGKGRKAIRSALITNHKNE